MALSISQARSETRWSGSTSLPFLRCFWSRLINLISKVTNMVFSIYQARPETRRSGSANLAIPALFLLLHDKLDIKRHQYGILYLSGSTTNTSSGSASLAIFTLFLVSSDKLDIKRHQHGFPFSIYNTAVYLLGKLDSGVEIRLIIKVAVRTCLWNIALVPHLGACERTGQKNNNLHKH